MDPNDRPPYQDFQTNPYPPYPPYPPKPAKSKGIAILFAMLIPGSGHFYLGLMKRGLSFFLSFAANIALIVMLSISFGVNHWMSEALFVPLIVFVSLMLPVQYFYEIFDVVHRTNRINSQAWSMEPWNREDLDQPPFKAKSLGPVLIAVGGVLLLYQTFPAAIAALLVDYGGTLFALLLIGGGGWMLFRMK